MKRGKRARYEIVEEPGKPRYDKFMFNLPRFWKSYNNIVDSGITDSSVDIYKRDYIELIAAYATCAISFEVPTAWMTAEEQQFKQNIEHEMNAVRRAAKDMNVRMQERISQEKMLCQ